ncbi:MAG: DMT family transporter [Bacillota bacterium]
MPRSPALGYTFITLAALLWSTLGIFGRLLYARGATALTVAASRPLLAAIILLVVIGATRPRLLRVKPRDLAFFAGYGLISVAVFYYTWFYAVEKTGVTTAVLLLYTAPAYVAVFSAIFFREPMTRVKWLALALALGGSVLVSRAYDPAALRLNGPGVAAALIAGVTYALYSVFGRLAGVRFSPWTTLFYTFAFGAVFLFAVWLPTSPGQAGVILRAWPLVLAAAVFPTIASYSLYLFGLSMVETSKASITANLEPVAAMFLAHVILGEQVAAPQLAGAALVLGGVLAIQVTDLLAVDRTRARRGTGEEGVNP